MRVEARKNWGNDESYDVILISESEEESQILDLLGNRVDADGIIENGQYELVLSDGYCEHYVRLKANIKENTK